MCPYVPVEIRAHIAEANGLTVELTVKPSGARVTCWGTLCSGTERPGQTQMKPSASATGSVDTVIPRQNAVEGILVQLPLPSYCQPW